MVHSAHRSQLVRLAAVLSITVGIALSLIPQPAASEANPIATAERRVEAAEKALVDAREQQSLLQAKLGILSKESQELVTRLEQTRAELRRMMVSAYLNAGDDSAALNLVTSRDFATASTRAQVPKQQATHLDEIRSVYEFLHTTATPKQREAAEQLAAIGLEVAEAENAAIQARAQLKSAILTKERSDAAAEAARLAAATAASTTAIPGPTSSPQPATGPAAPSTPAAAAIANAAAPTTPATTAPPPPAAPAVATAPAAPTLSGTPPPGGPTEAQWLALRMCESTNNYKAINKTGKYRGAYQFDYKTWNSLGPQGDPAAAAPAEQDLRAKLLYAKRGSRPWPECGKHLR